MKAKRRLFSIVVVLIFAMMVISGCSGEFVFAGKTGVGKEVAEESAKRPLFRVESSSTSSSTSSASSDDPMGD